MLGLHEGRMAGTAQSCSFNDLNFSACSNCIIWSVIPMKEEATCYDFLVFIARLKSWPWEDRRDIK